MFEYTLRHILENSTKEELNVDGDDDDEDDDADDVDDEKNDDVFSFSQIVWVPRGAITMGPHQIGKSQVRKYHHHLTSS